MNPKTERIADIATNATIVPSNGETNETHPDEHLLSPYNVTHINATLQYDQPRTKLHHRLFASCALSPLKCLHQTLPITDWLSTYKWKQSFFGDVMSGITVGVMHVPQGMAYGLLGNVPPIVGIYMAYFPVLIYTLFGTSRHASMGTFGVVCLMTGKMVSTYGSDDYADANGVRMRNPDLPPEFPIYTNMEVAVTITFTVAITQMAMYLLRLGVVANLLSETFIKGFTCACSTYVIGVMTRDILGLPTEKRRGMFAFPLTVYDVVMAVPQANKVTMYISIVSVVLMIINLYIFKPMVARLTKVPIPMEITMICLGTLFSYLFSFNDNFNVSIVGDLPTGIPQLTIPKFELIPTIVVETIGITVVSYIIAMSMALILAHGEKYEIDGNQELLALGAANVVGSFFSAMPITASLSRSVIQKVVGGSTQIASIVSVVFLTAILLWVGPVFQFLPRCVLACIILVALRYLYTQVRYLPAFWRDSKWNGLLFLATYLSTLLLTIDIGLLVGVSMSALHLFYCGQTAYACLLGVVPHTEIYLDVERFKSAEEPKHMKIFHYAGSLNFSTMVSFKRTFHRIVNVHSNDTTQMVIIDFSALVNLDPSGVNQLFELRKELHSKSIEMIIAGCSPPIFEVLRKLVKNNRKETDFELFPRVHDAVVFARSAIGEKVNEE